MWISNIVPELVVILPCHDECLTLNSHERVKYLQLSHLLQIILEDVEISRCEYSGSMLLNGLIFSNRWWYFLVSITVIVRLVLTEANYTVLITHCQINYCHTVVQVKVKA